MASSVNVPLLPFTVGRITELAVAVAMSILPLDVNLSQDSWSPWPSQPQDHSDACHCEARHSTVEDSVKGGKFASIGSRAHQFPHGTRYIKWRDDSRTWRKTCRKSIDVARLRVRENIGLHGISHSQTWLFSGGAPMCFCVVARLFNRAQELPLNHV